MRHALTVTLSFGIVLGATSVAHTQPPLPTRTWVSRAGDDANPCSQNSPCRTFAGALGKTAVRGEINCLDAGTFDPVTITKSITIDCNGALGGITATGAGERGIIVGCFSCIVTLRNLVIDGGGTGADGVLFIQGDLLIIENTKVFGFSDHGITVRQAFISSPGKLNLAIRNSTVSASPIGVETQVGTTVVSHSVIVGNTGFGLLATLTGHITAEANVLAFNNVAVQAGNNQPSDTNAVVLLSNNDVYTNFIGFGCGGGILGSNGHNRNAGNTARRGPTCAPTVTITEQ